MIWDWLQTSGQFLEKLATSYTTINVEWYSAVFYQICFLTSAIIFSSGVLVVGSYEVWDVWKCVLSLLKRLEIKLRLKTIIQHSTWARAFFAIVWKACSTFIASLALVSKYGMSFLEWHHCWARLVDTALLSRSILLPSTTNGKLSGSRGLACMGTISQVSRSGQWFEIYSPPGWETRPSNCPEIWRCWAPSRRRWGRSSRRRGRKRHRGTGISPDRLMIS